jgi:hypothetical protein
METDLNQKWSFNGDSKNAFIQRIAYPCDSIQAKIDAVKIAYSNGWDIDNIKKLYNPTNDDLNMGKAYGLDLPILFDVID